jgi:hypothetical protein
MSANPNLRPAPSAAEPSGEQLFFVLTIAFLVLVAVIVAAAFLPMAVGVGVSFAAVVVVVGIVGRYIGRLLGDE